MSMSILKNNILQWANFSTNNKTTVRVGKVKTYDPVNYTCSVILLPDEIETGMLPIYSIMAGNGWGVFCAPTEGDLCEVRFVDGNQNAGFVSVFGFGGEKRPINTPSGQITIKHKSGSYIELNNDGNVYIGGNSSIKIGDKNQSFYKLVNEAFKTLYNNHSHPSNGAPPDQQMTNNELTTILEGN